MAASERKLWWVTFVIVATLGSLWALASPIASVPDEDAHIVEAVATSHLRSPVRVVDVTESDDKGPPRQDTWYLLPGGYEQVRDQRCYAFQAAVTPACAEPLVPGPEAEVRTSAGSYPPTFYAMVGWPSHLFDTARAVYAMRLVAAAVAAALVASALVAAASVAGRSVAVGIVLALPPMALYLFGSVNPSSLEIASAVATWATVSALLTDQGDPTPRAVARVAAAVLLLAAARPSGPVVAFGILAAVVAAFATTERLRTLLRSTTVRIGATVTVIGVAASSAWVLVVDMPLAGIGVPGLSLGERLRDSTELLPARTGQLVGRLGWLDTPLPTALVWLWMLAVAALLLCALRLGSWRERAVLLAVAVATPASAVIVEAVQVPEVGLLWQGRYSLPVFAGVPVLSAIVAGRRASPTVVPGVAAGLGVALAAAIHVAAFSVAMSRYTAGSLDWLAWAGDREWDPPGGAVVLSSLFLAVVVGGSLTLVRWMATDIDGRRATPGQLQRTTPGVSRPAEPHRPATGQSVGSP